MGNHHASETASCACPFGFAKPERQPADSTESAESRAALTVHRMSRKSQMQGRWGQAHPLAPLTEQVSSARSLEVEELSSLWEWGVSSLWEWGVSSLSQAATAIQKASEADSL